MFGGPDKAGENFTPIQKAISYSMTSFLTTGGIRGGKKKMDKFYPRSFNLGIKKSIFYSLNGFSDMRFGEDMDLSMRTFENGYSGALIQDAYVYHKRRTNFKSFYKQVFGSGTARIELTVRHKGTLKIVHLFPTMFVFGILVSLLLSIFCSVYFILPILILTLIIFLDSLIKERSLKVALLSICASYVQTCGYGLGCICVFFLWFCMLYFPFYTVGLFWPLIFFMLIIIELTFMLC